MTRKTVNIALVIVIAVFLILLIPSPASNFSKKYVRSFATTLSRPFINAGRKVSSSFSVIFEIKNLRSRNKDLENAVIELKSENASLQEEKTENQSLKQLLDYKKISDQKLILASVTAIDPNSYFDSITVDRGTDDGVAVGQAVIFSGALIGKVQSVSEKNSQILLITSKDSVVQVMLSNSRTTGILRGGINGITLENIPLDVKIDENETIITSGLGAGLPKGIYVGNTGKEVSAKSDIFKTVDVVSPVDFSKIEFLFIVGN